MTSQPPNANLPRRRILFVDDDEGIQKLLARIAEKFQFDLIKAVNGEEALAQVRSQPVDLVLLDIMMPKMDGRDVCRQMKADAKLREIPVIIFSAKSTQSDRLLGLELGADDYITKPFHLEVLMRKIEYFLQEREARKPL